MFFIKYSKNPKELAGLVEAGNGRFKNLERRVADVINAVTGAKFHFEEEKERVDMCQALQEMQDISRAEGLAKGELQKAQEVTKNSYAIGIGIDQIAQIIGYTVETVREWLGIS